LLALGRVAGSANFMTNDSWVTHRSNIILTRARLFGEGTLRMVRGESVYY